MSDDFHRLADLLELRGEVSEAAALRRLARAGDAAGRQSGSGAFSARTRVRADEIRAGRGKVLIAAAERELPRDFQRLLQSGLLTAADLVLLHRQLGILTTGDLALALEGHILAHHGVPEEVASRARRALEQTGSDVRFTLGRAFEIVDPLIAALQEEPQVTAACVAGSLRRIEPTVRDLRIVAATTEPDRVAAALSSSPKVESVRVHGTAGITAAAGSHDLSVKVTRPEHYGGALLFHTGSREHLAMLQERGERSGVQLTPDGLVKSGRPVPASTEADAYALLDLPFIIPELRQGTDEIDDPPAGAAGRFVEFGDIRGDLHMHTTFSDGRDGLEAMVAACVGIGYEYIAICDHSQSSAASRTMSEDDLARQGEEIDVLQERYPAIRILKGAEVDILPDGRLDFSDRVLGRLDVVLASLHDRAGHGPDRLLRRYRAAAEHPLVSILTHPANRLVGRYDGYDLDFEALFDLAARTGTLLEVDGAPSHLDLDGSLARAAVEAGVLLAIDSDCHHARLLEAQMRLGIGTARRGRVQPPHVVNSRPVREALRLLQRKRAATV